MILRIGEVAPTAVEMTVTTEDPDLDLTDVTGATFEIQKPDASEVSWTATLGTASATSLELSYELDTPTEIDIQGKWRLYVSMTLPTGTVRTDVQVLTVKGEFEP